jgi:putative membrane protein
MLITDALVSAFHYLGFMTLFAALIALHLIFNDEATVARQKRMLDLAYIFLAGWMLTLGTGLTKTFLLAPSALYMKNGLFHLKLTLFALMILLFIPLFLKVLKGPALPTWIKHTLRINMLILIIIPILAALMARGVGFFG